MSRLYLTSNGSKLSIDGGRFKVEQKDKMVRTIPKESIESIFVFGNSMITTPCMQYLLEKGISVCYFSSTGKYFGRLESTSHNKIELVKKQINTFDQETYTLQLGRKMIFAKIRNQEILLKRYVKNWSPELQRSVSLMRTYQNKVQAAEDRNQLMGYEGIAARTYFDVLSKIINPDFAFTGRTKQPPRDKFNSLLSLGYTLLMYEIYAKIEAEGLTPYYPILHSVSPNHPALASDLMEEWRAVIVDATVLSMIQGNEISPDDFEEENGGIFLTNEGMKKFVKKYERKLNTDMKYLQYDNKTYSMREAFGVQCNMLKKSIEAEDANLYCPIVLK